MRAPGAGCRQQRRRRRNAPRSRPSASQPGSNPAPHTARTPHVSAQRNTERCEDTRRPASMRPGACDIRAGRARNA
eukprot:2898768-Rhodomonas_salina.1